MRSKVGFWLGIAFGGCVAVAAFAEERDLRWTFNGTPAEGYAITLESASPAPGTPLTSGASVEFEFEVAYTLTIAKKGVVVLVLQDDQNRNAAPDQPQQITPVEGESGKLSLKQKIVVPAGAEELRIFIPLAPDGIAETSGEIVLRYPITSK